MNNLKILYEDNHIIVVIKPYNVPVQADSSNDLDMLTIIKNYIKEKYNKPGNVYLGLVHRLDRPVGGVMVFAKTSKAASRLSEEVRTNKIHKTYLTVVHGVLDKKCDKLINKMSKDEKTHNSYIDEKNGKEAILEYKVIKEEDNLSLLKINLILAFASLSEFTCVKIDILNLPDSLSFLMAFTLSFKATESSINSSQSILENNLLISFV